ncbi:Zinc finger CCCH domain-containing protein 3, partial [Linum perenne]
RVRNREICNFVVIFFPWLLSFSKPIHREHCKEISHCVLLRLILFFKNQSLLRSGFQRRSKSSFRGYLLMPDTDDSSSNQNQQVKSNAGSSHSSDNVEGAVKSLKLNENPCQNDGDVTKPGSYPERPGEPDCMYYLRKGVCGYGINCRYNHPKASQHRVELPERAGQPDCGYYLKTGTCKFGTTCKYHHPKDRNGAGPVSYNRLGLPIRNGQALCPSYATFGICKFGSSCRFDHPFIGYPYSYNLAVPPCSLPELAASMVTCYRNPFYFPSDQMNNAGIMKKTTTTTSSTTTKSEETVDTSDSSFEVLT